MCNGQSASCTLASCPRCRLPILPEFCGTYEGITTRQRVSVRQDDAAYIRVESSTSRIPVAHYPVDMFRDLADSGMVRPISEGSN